MSLFCLSLICLFCGCNDDMKVICICRNPVKPEYQSAMVHVYGCDPEVVEDDM